MNDNSNNRSRNSLAGTAALLSSIADGEAHAASDVLYRLLVEQLPGAVYLADPGDAGLLRFVGPQIESQLGYTPGEWLADPYFWRTRLHPDDRELILAEEQSNAGVEESYDIQYRLLHRDGYAVWIRDQGVLIRDADGTPQYWLGFVLDISDQREAQNALLEAEERYRSLVENLPAVVFTVGAEQTHIPTYMSPQVEGMLGYSLEEWRADPNFWQSLIHPDDVKAAIAEVRRTDETGEPYSMEFRMMARDGSVVWVQNDATLIRDAEDNPGYWQGVIVDITDRKLVEDALREAEARYRTLVEQISVVTYVEPINGGGVPSYVSPQIETLLGYPHSHWDEHPDIAAYAIHPDDYDRWSHEARRIDETGETLDIKHRMVTADGSTIWVRNICGRVVDRDGTPRFWQGTLQDITEAVLAEQRLAESEQRHRSLFENNPNPVCSFDLEGRLLSANAALAELIGYDATVMADDSLIEFVQPADLPAMRAFFRLAASGKPQDFECELVHRDGTLREVHVTLLPIVVEQDIVGVYAILNDIGERKELERLLKHMAFHDPLTGLPNRRLFIDRVDQALAALARRPGMVALFFIDLDGFKLLNDRLGHDIGDQALKQAGQIISSCVRRTDTVARLGGDEFTVLLTDVQDLDNAVEVANRILEKFARPVEVSGYLVTFTASIGVVTSSSPGDGPEALLRQSDMAMYQAKAGGRARYTVYSGDPVGLPDRI